jgi:hypothetical protein
MTVCVRKWLFATQMPRFNFEMPVSVRKYPVSVLKWLFANANAPFKF